MNGNLVETQLLLQRGLTQNLALGVTKSSANFQ